MENNDFCDFGCHEVAQKESQSIATIAARNFAVTFASGAASPPHSGTACPSHCSRRAQYTCWRKNNEGKTPFKIIRESSKQMPRRRESACAKLKGKVAAQCPSICDLKMRTIARKSGSSLRLDKAMSKIGHIIICARSPVAFEQKGQTGLESSCNL